MSLTLYGDVARGIVESLRQRDTWASHHLYTVKDWQHEVAEGDTRRGYHDWLEYRITHALQDREIGFDDLTPPALTLVATNPETPGK